jgi:hypothetical protein
LSFVLDADEDSYLTGTQTLNCTLPVRSRRWAILQTIRLTKKNLSVVYFVRRITPKTSRASGTVVRH